MSLRLRLRRFAFLLLLFALLAVYGWIRANDRPAIRAADGQTIDVRDGDTLVIGETKIRIYGIDAPELHQRCTDTAGAEWPCGEAARDRLEALLATPAVSCAPRTRDRFGRTLGTCRTAQVPDVGKAMISEGLAVRFVFNGDGDYALAEASARIAKRGLWAGPFQSPQDWRAANPRSDAP